jgi:predicted phosphodiesterase
MRIALVADIHGNLLALDAVLAELRREGYDELLCLGDVAVGPQAREAVERVEELGGRVVLGNWDAYFLDGFPPPQTELARKLVEVGEWWNDRLDDAHRTTMRRYESEIELELGDGRRLLAFHGSPRSFEDFIFASTPADELERMLDGRLAPLMAGGHTHFQMLRRHEDTVLLNPGSVGLPFARPAPLMQISPWAEYGLLTVDDARLRVELRRTAFDVEAHVRSILASAMPLAQWWAGLWVWKPPRGLLSPL